MIGSFAVACGTRVVFTCMFGNRVFTFSYEASDIPTAEKLAAILRENDGRNLSMIGLREIQEN